MQCRTWKFDPSLPAARIRRLSAYADFDHVLGLLLMVPLDVTCAIVSPQDRRLAGAVRVEYVIRLPDEAFDAFFNSSAGYRAQYCISCEQGLAAEKAVCNALAGALVDATMSQVPDPIERAIALRTIRVGDTTVWAPDSAGEELLRTDHLTVQIAEPRWVERARAAFFGAGPPDVPPEIAKAERGVLAPTSDTLIVKGGWMRRGDGQRVTNALKEGRARDIHEYGWT